MQKKFGLIIFFLLACLISCEKTGIQEGTTSLSDTTALEVSLPTKEELPYSGILYCQYAEEVGYYHCTYVEYDQVTVWISDTRPNMSSPNIGGSNIIYQEKIDPVLYIQAVDSLVAQQFEKWDDSINVYCGTNEEFAAAMYEQWGPASLDEPEYHIAVYNEQGLVNWGAWLGNTSPYSVISHMDAIHNSLTWNGERIEKTFCADLVGILQIQTSTYTSYTARFYTAEQMITWKSVSYPPDYDAPLTSDAQEDVKICAVNGLHKVENMDILPIMTSTPQEYAVDGGTNHIFVFYYADGTRRMIAREPCRDEWHPVWIHLTEQLYSTVLE